MKPKARTLSNESRQARRYAGAMMCLLLAVPVVACLACGIGAYYIAPWQVPGILLHGSEDGSYGVLTQIRFPRVALAAIVGAALGCAGAGLQGLMRNPLADPGLLGITSGASVGAAIWVVLLGRDGVAMVGLPLSAFAGGLAVFLFVWRFAEGQGRLSTAALLLAGIAFNGTAGAVLGFLSVTAEDEELRSLTFWQLGSLGRATWPMVLVTAGAVAVGLSPILLHARALNAFSLGESGAFHLGVSVERAKRVITLGCALVVGASVAAAGGIGFIGLIVPHLLRLAVGADHRWLLPASALGGAHLLVLADLGARTLTAPGELPVGVFTAAIGAPIFLYLLARHKRELLHA